MKVIMGMYHYDCVIITPSSSWLCIPHGPAKYRLTYDRLLPYAPSTTKAFLISEIVGKGMEEARGLIGNLVRGRDETNRVIIIGLRFEEQVFLRKILRNL